MHCGNCSPIDLEDIVHVADSYGSTFVICKCKNALGWKGNQSIFPRENRILSLYFATQDREKK